MKKIIILALIVVLVFAFATTAFADSFLSHSGYSRIGYTTSDSVTQRYDNNLRCEIAEIDPGGNMRAYAVNGGGTQVSTSSVIFTTNANLYIPDYSSVRNVYLRIYNAGDSIGDRIYTRGFWELFS